VYEKQCQPSTDKTLRKRVEAEISELIYEMNVMFERIGLNTLYLLGNVILIDFAYDF